MCGSIKWNERKRLGTKQESYYDRTTWHVPFTGTYDQNKVHAAIHAKVHTGIVQLSAVRKLDDTTIEFETIYCIGE